MRLESRAVTSPWISLYAVEKIWCWYNSAPFKLINHNCVKYICIWEGLWWDGGWLSTRIYSKEASGGRRWTAPEVVRSLGDGSPKKAWSHHGKILRARENSVEGWDQLTNICGWFGGGEGEVWRPRRTLRSSSVHGWPKWALREVLSDQWKLSISLILWGLYTGIQWSWTQWLIEGGADKLGPPCDVRW